MTSEESKQFRDNFFSQAPNLREPIEAMMAQPNICVYVKDTESRFILTNNRLRSIIHGNVLQDELTGFKNSDHFPALIAEAYEVNDRRVFEGEIIRNELWLVPTIKGTPGWYLSSKTPLSDYEGAIIGLLGTLYPIATPEDQRTFFGELQRVLEYLETHFVDEITGAQLAKVAGLSLPHFNRKFRSLLRLSPMEYVNSLRIQEAQRLLTSTTQLIGEISAVIGFYDQSHFTKRFKKVVGMTPLAYRNKFML